MDEMFENSLLRF